MTVSPVIISVDHLGHHTLSILKIGMETYSREFSSTTVKLELRVDLFDYSFEKLSV